MADDIKIDSGHQEFFQGVLPPLRGLVLSSNCHGVPFPLTSLKKWIRLNSRVFKVEKIDLAIDRSAVAHLGDLLEFVRNEKIALSLRVSDLQVFEELPNLADAGLHDIFIAPDTVDRSRMAACISMCKDAGLPVRVQVLASSAADTCVEELLEALHLADSVNVVVSDAFSKFQQPATSLDECRKTVDWMNALVCELDARGIEANLIGLPYCHVTEANYPNVVSQTQFFSDHQQYAKRSYELAEKVYAGGIHRMNKVMESLLSQGMSLHTAIDRAVLPWILDHPRLYARVWMFHKFTRHFNFLKKDVPLPENVDACEVELAKLRAKQQQTMGPECARCKFQRICDHETETFTRQLPFLDIKAIGGEPVASSILVSSGRTRYYDGLDDARRKLPEHLKTLADNARDIVMRIPPTREIPVHSYEIEDHYNPPDDASKRWFSFSNCELLSTVLTRVAPPFTLGLTFGGGIAAHIGFSFGRQIKILCPMIDYSHKLTLHVDKDGYYVLLRDGAQVRPTEFDGNARLPVRLSGVLEPRISVHNVDGFMISQTIMLWEGDASGVVHIPKIKYSIIIVSTRYTRRLQAALLSLAHQKGIDPACMEVIVAYVPGIDGTDDLIESLSFAHPHLRIVRSSFSESHVHSKGFMINESVHVASGEWIILMDSDIVVPPELFQKIDAVESDTHFIAPDGRKMLKPEMTGRILLGEIRPWEEFDAISKATKDYRYREGESIPCGFFQCVRRDIIERIPYHELDHFEASDWIFARDVVNTFGKEIRLEGVAVLHMDHGGRQWYGTAKHR
jgi:hypothetical protein